MDDSNIIEEQLKFANNLVRKKLKSGRYVYIDENNEQVNNPVFIYYAIESHVRKKCQGIRLVCYDRESLLTRMNSNNDINKQFIDGNRFLICDLTDKDYYEDYETVRRLEAIREQDGVLYADKLFVVFNMFQYYIYYGHNCFYISEESYFSEPIYLRDMVKHIDKFFEVLIVHEYTYKQNLIKTGLSNEINLHANNCIMENLHPLLTMSVIKNNSDRLVIPRHIYIPSILFVRGGNRENTIRQKNKLLIFLSEYLTDEQMEKVREQNNGYIDELLLEGVHATDSLSFDNYIALMCDIIEQNYNIELRFHENFSDTSASGANQNYINLDMFDRMLKEDLELQEKRAKEMVELYDDNDGNDPFSPDAHIMSKLYSENKLDDLDAPDEDDIYVQQYYGNSEKKELEQKMIRVLEFKKKINDLGLFKFYTHDYTYTECILRLYYNYLIIIDNYTIDVEDELLKRYADSNNIVFNRRLERTIEIQKIQKLIELFKILYEIIPNFEEYSDYKKKNTILDLNKDEFENLKNKIRFMLLSDLLSKEKIDNKSDIRKKEKIARLLTMKYMDYSLYDKLYIELVNYEVLINLISLIINYVIKKNSDYIYNKYIRPKNLPKNIYVSYFIFLRIIKKLLLERKLVEKFNSSTDPEQLEAHNKYVTLLIINSIIRKLNAMGEQLLTENRNYPTKTRDKKEYKVMAVVSLEDAKAMAKLNIIDEDEDDDVENYNYEREIALGMTPMRSELRSSMDKFHSITSSMQANRDSRIKSVLPATITTTPSVFREESPTRREFRRNNRQENISLRRTSIAENPDNREGGVVDWYQRFVQQNRNRHAVHHSVLQTEQKVPEQKVPEQKIQENNSSHSQTVRDILIERNSGGSSGSGSERRLSRERQPNERRSDEKTPILLEPRYSRKEED